MAAVALAGCGSSNGPSDPVRGGSRPVPSLIAPRAVIWAVGDGANGSDPARAVAARIAAGRVARLLYLGDVYPRGTRPESRAPRERRAPGLPFTSSVHVGL